MTSVCVIPGFAEGWHTSRKLHAALQAADFVIATDPAEADVIIAHSGGCFMVPPDNRAKLILLIGIAYWPRKLWLASTAKKLRLEIKHSRQERAAGKWLRKLATNIWYVGNAPRNLRMLRAWKGTDNIWHLPSAKTVVIRNRDDVYCTPNPHELPFKQQPTFISLHGGHDDCWDHPETYVDIVQSLYD